MSSFMGKKSSIGINGNEGSEMRYKNEMGHWKKNMKKKCNDKNRKGKTFKSEKAEERK